MAIPTPGPDGLGIGLGEAAGLATAACWVVTSLCFAAAGRRVGSGRVNLIRIFMAVVMLGGVHWIVFHTPLPQVDARALWFLIASGVIGLSIGDQLLFTALVDIGSRLSTLMMTLAPPIAAVLAWFTLGEHLSALKIIGIVVTVGGIAWVAAERPLTPPVNPGHRTRGFIFGLLAAACQAIGFILAKFGMGFGRDEALAVNPWSATLVRMVFAAMGVAVIVWATRAVQARRGGTHPGRMSPRAWTLISLGAVFGPVLGVWLSLVALDNTDAGVAATLMSMSPVFILPFAVIIEKERVTWRAILGAMIAIVGVALLTFAK